MSFPRYPAYKDSGVEWLGEVPEHWKVGMAGFYLTITSGFPFPSTGFTDDESDTKLLRGINVSVSRLKWDEVVYWRRAPGDGLDQYELRAGDLVIGMDRPLIREGMRVARVTNKDLPCLLLQRVALLKATTQLLPDYVHMMLSSPMFVAHFVPEATGVSVPHISPEQIKSFVVPIPPESEQTAITSFLQEEIARIDALTAEQERLTELLAEKRLAVMSHAVTKGLNPNVPMKDSGLAWLGAVPAHWGMSRLDLMFSQTTFPVSVDGAANYQELGVRSHGKGVFHKEQLRGIDLDEKEVYWVQPGALVFNIVFAWEGAVAVTSADDAGLVASHRFPMFMADRRLAVPDFYKYFLTTNPGIRLLDWHSPGAAGRNRTLNRGDLFKEQVPAPPVAEQMAICEALRAEFSRLDALIAEAQRAIDLLQERRAALISAAVTGQIDVRYVRLQERHVGT